MGTYKLETATLNSRVNRPKSTVGLMWDKLTKPIAEPPYKQLPDYHIRVLKIKPGTSQHPVRVKLQVIDPRKAKYTALSYVWDQRDEQSGEQSGGSRTILCGGSAVDVNINLFNALCHLRNIQTDVPIFVDALCINFDDNAERTAYLEIMGHIYARAASVIIWLGQKDSSSDETTFIMKRLVNAIDWRRIQGSSNNYNFHDSHFFQHIGMEPLNVKQWRQVHAFCQMKWFTRYWAFFELALAKSALFLWGDSCMELNFLIDLGMILSLSGWLDDFQRNLGDDPTVNLTRMLGPVSRIRETPVWHPQNEEFSVWMKNEYRLYDEEQKAWQFFEILLESAEAFECRDPRDKFFAPLMFARTVYAGKPMNKQWPTPTYAKPVDKVHNEFCTLILQYTGQQSILSQQVEQVRQPIRSSYISPVRSSHVPPAQSSYVPSVRPSSQQIVLPMPPQQMPPPVPPQNVHDLPSPPQTSIGPAPQHMPPPPPPHQTYGPTHSRQTSLPTVSQQVPLPTPSQQLSQRPSSQHSSPQQQLRQSHATLPVATPTNHVSEVERLPQPPAVPPHQFLQQQLYRQQLQQLQSGQMPR